MELQRTERSVQGVVKYVAGNRALLADGRDVIELDLVDFRSRRLVRLPVSAVGRMLAHSGLARRLLRYSIHHILPAGDDALVVFAFGRVMRVELKTARIADCGRIRGSRPLFVADGGDGCFYYGEYRGNRERSPVHIWASDCTGGDAWEARRQFEHVRHIHGVFKDEYTGWWWVTTGDENDECGIWVSRDNFSSVELVLGGAQQVRAVQLLFTSDHVYYGSDTEREANFIYRLSRQTWKTERLQAVEGPIFYGCSSGAELMFSTVCEPSSVTSGEHAVVWRSTDGATWSRFAMFKKDMLPMKLFQYGQVGFPQGPGADSMVLLSPFATRGDQTTIIIPRAH